jgi:hypothetical protein
MKKYLLFATFMIICNMMYSQTKEDTELYLYGKIEKLNSIEVKQKKVKDKIMNDISIMTYNEVNYGKLIHTKIYSDYYKNLNKLPYKAETYIIDISKIYSIELININNNNYSLRIKSKENCYKYNDTPSTNINLENLKSENKLTVCDIDLIIFNVSELSEIEKNIKALKHLVNLYGGKILDNLF